MRPPPSALLSGWIVALAVTGAGAEVPAMHAGNLAHALDRIAVTGRVLYIAAHPDDENTRLLAYLANQRHVGTAYLSVTRGGGGQNLIGREQAELLDVIRTEELLAARRLDGAQQRFTRMRDFGYSKRAQETFDTWGHDEALADVVWVIRTFQPDVIIARFSEEPPNHGHHTASAILAREAFSAAADPTRFPEQMALGARPWKATRLLRNVSSWRNEPPPKDAMAQDVGDYDPRLGLSYGELAARSRSQHQSQGFGVPGERGSLIERFVVIAGSAPSGDLLDGVELGWNRWGAAGASLTGALDEARAALDRDRPENALPALLQAHRILAALPDEPRVGEARARLDQVILAASGFFVRATSAQPSVAPRQRVEIAVEVIVRRPVEWKLKRVSFPGAASLEPNAALPLNRKSEFRQEIAVPASAPISTPYWLAEPSLPGRQVVRDGRLVGEPNDAPPLQVRVELERDGRVVYSDAPVEFSWVDPIQGERGRPVRVAPPATVSPARDAVMFPSGKPATVVLRVRAGQDGLEGSVVLPLPEGWRAEPPKIPVKLAKTGDEAAVRFVVTPAPGSGAITVRPAIEVDGKAWSYREDVIDYPHIPMQVVLRPASLDLVRLAITVPTGLVGYVQGSGDSVADDLAHLGMRVELLDDDALRASELARFHAIVVGIRAYNTRDALKSSHDRLMRYVEEGGTVVVQYNTQNWVGPLETPIGPFPLKIGRGRVTDQRAAMEMLVPDHELLVKPNRITAADFEGWVQERGLYYGETWDARYTAILGAADPGEEPLRGGVLYARHGRGRYIYTGLAFFRELPAGVPGAYRLFMNLIGGR